MEASRELVKVVAVLGLGLGLWSCGVGTSPAFDRLPAEVRAAYDRCWDHMRLPICGATTDVAESLNCARASSNTYAFEDNRQGWLTSHGCPSTVASSGGQAPVEAAGPTPAPTPMIAGHPATHRCRHPNGEEADFAAGQPCAAAGYADVRAPLPMEPLRPPRPQVMTGPRVERCYTSTGLVVPIQGGTCAAAGLTDSPAPAVP